MSSKEPRLPTPNEPCPFCGEQPELHKHNDQGGKVYLMFGCFSNACQTEACYIDGSYLADPSAEELEIAVRGLADKWNAALIARPPELLDCNACLRELLRMTRNYITTDCDLARYIDQELRQ